MSVNYTWKCSGIFKADPDKVCEEISGLGSSVTPRAVLEAARDVNSELHKCFEWNDTKAAEKYRLQQARHILCNLVFKTAEPSAPKLRVYHLIESKRSYVPVVHIQQNRDEYEELLKRAYLDLQLFRRRYSALAELDEIMELIGAVTES